MITAHLILKIQTGKEAPVILVAFTAAAQTMGLVRVVRVRVRRFPARVMQALEETKV